MKIFLNQIPKTGLSAKETVDATPYNLDTEEVKVVSPLEMSYRIFREEENLTVFVSIRCVTQLTCGRCLGTYESPLLIEGEFFHPVGRAYVIDVTDDIRQEILLEYPMRPLCQETCRGICPLCGQNLNENTCNCQEVAQNVKRKTKI